MRLDHLTLAAAACLALSGCTTSAGEGMPAAVGCDASRFAAFIGQDRAVLLATTFAAPIRIIDPDDVVTQDFDPDRINFVVGRDGKIEHVYRG